MFKSHNEIYDIISKNRIPKPKKFDYLCPQTPEDYNKYLNLDCNEAKMLKYIMKIHIHRQKSDVRLKNIFVQENNENKLNTAVLQDVIEKTKNSLETLNKNIKNWRDKQNIEKNNSLWRPIVYVTTFIFFFPALIIPFLYFTTKDIIITKDVLDYEFNKLEKRYKNKYLQEIDDFINVNSEIINIVISLFQKINVMIPNINIQNICVNGKSVKSGKWIHKKCAKKDYNKNIKKIFNMLDKSVENTDDTAKLLADTNTKNLQNLMTKYNN